LSSRPRHIRSVHAGLRGAWIGFVPVLLAYAFFATRHLALPGVYMDSVNPDYLVVKVLNPQHEPIIAWVLNGNYLVSNRFPLLVALYHGSQPFWVGLPFFWLFGTSVEGIRLTHAVFGLGVVAATYWTLLRFRVQPMVAALGCVALAADPAFTYAFRTQSQITLGACAWLLVAIATLPWYGNSPRRRWLPAVSGIFYGWSVVAYFIYGFFFPAIAIAVAALSRRMPSIGTNYLFRWLAGLVAGLIPSLIGYALLIKDAGGVPEAIRFYHEQQAALGVFASSLTLGERVGYGWTMLRAVVSDAWHHSMMFGEWVEVPGTNVKLALLAGLPLAALIVLETRRMTAGPLRLLVALPVSFMLAGLVFGGRLGGHHYIVLLPLLYAALALAIDELVGTLRAPVAVVAGTFVLLGGINVAGQIAEGERLDQTHGVGFMSDAINHLAGDLLRAESKPFVYFPDWGLAMPVALVTRGTVGMDSVADYAAARRRLCAGKDVAVALMSGDRAARREEWRAQLQWSKPDVTTYAQFDGKPLIDLITFRGDARHAGC
jgi:hypothetical protein